MNVAVPIDEELTLYRYNPYTAPKFAIYYISGEKSDVSFTLTRIVDNPRYLYKENKIKSIEVNCECDTKNQNDIEHICEHYALVETIGNCSYLLADKFCNNISHTLKNAGITVFKIPTIIKSADLAIQNFLIGASYANNIQNINHAS